MMLRLKPSHFYVGPSTKNLRSPLLAKCYIKSLIKIRIPAAMLYT